MFHSARLKLTAWYLLIIMLISISFSAVIFKVISNEVERYVNAQRFRIERRLTQGDYFPSDIHIQGVVPTIPIMDSDLIDETKRRLLYVLFIINGGIFIAAGGLGFILAGRTLRPIQDMLDEQNRFISDSSHELRTPLTSLKSAMEVNLRDKNLTLKDAKVLISESIVEVNKLQSLSDELLQLAQYQKPNGYAKFEKFSVGEIVKRTVHKIEPVARLKDLIIMVDTDDIQIEGNKYGVSDLLMILLDNAVKYSTEKKTIKVRSYKNDGHVLISVKDQGIGISEKDIPHIFDRFYRADTARSKNEAGGYGLGLAIAKKIVDIHHGTISVKSKLNKGSEFSVQLPLKQRGG